MLRFRGQHGHRASLIGAASGIPIIFFLEARRERDEAESEPERFPV
jgi:hypothetical protein